MLKEARKIANVYIIAHVADDIGEATVRGALEAGEPGTAQRISTQFAVLHTEWCVVALGLASLLPSDLHSATCCVDKGHMIQVKLACTRYELYFGWHARLFGA